MIKDNQAAYRYLHAKNKKTRRKAKAMIQAAKKQKADR